MRSPPVLNLPVALVRFWPRSPARGSSGAGRPALEIASELARLPGFARLDEWLFAVLPAGGRTAVFDFAVRWSSEVQSRLSRAGSEREVSGFLIFPGQILQKGDDLVAERDFLLDDLEHEAPELAAGRIFLTGYAAKWLRTRYLVDAAEVYSGPSGRRVPLFRLSGERPRPLPWHNPEILGRRLTVERPRVRQALREAQHSPGLRVRGPLGVGKGHAVWHFLEERGDPRIWIEIGRALPGDAVLGRRLAVGLRRLAGDGPAAASMTGAGGELDPEPDEAADRIGAALREARLELGSPPWVVCDLFETITETDLELLGRLLQDPRLSGACRWILIGRPGLEDPPSVTHLPAVEIPPMDEEETDRYQRQLFAGLGIGDEMIGRWLEVTAGNPFALEEGLVGLVHSGSIRQVYGSFFFDGAGDLDYQPSPRWVRFVEAEARRLGEPLPLRILAVSGRAAAASHLEITAAELDVALASRWHEPYVAAGWLTETESSWGPALAFANRALAHALVRTVTDESSVPLRHALGEVMAADRRTDSGGWHAYRLLAGSPEALPPLLDFTSGSDESSTRDELFRALSGELRMHRQRGGDAATELDLLWTLLPMGQRLGGLRELESDLDRALELAEDRPRKYVALLALRADLDQELGRFRDAEQHLRQALAGSEGVDETRRAAIFIRLGDLLLHQERLREARELFESLQEVLDPSKRAALAATCSFYLGNVALREKRLEDALEHHEKAHELRRERELDKQLGASLSALGAVHMALGDYPTALDYYRRAEETITEHGGAGELAFARRGIGRALSLLGNHLAATKPLRSALETKQGRDAVGESLARLDFAANQLELGNVERALSEARHAHFQLSLTPETSLLGDAEQLLGRVLMRQNQEAGSRQHFAEARRLHLQHSDRSSAAVDISWLLELALGRQDRQAIESLSAELEELLEDLPYPAFGEVLHFRLYKAFDWQRRHGVSGSRADELLRRAYQELMRKTAFLSPELRHAFLYQDRDHQALLDAATSIDFSFPRM